MLEEMRIRGLGVIDDVVLRPAPGLTVLTGETGAGKTMVVQGLALLFGGRADAGRVRPGAQRALVEGRLALAADSAAVARALDAGADLDEGALLISRSVSADGRSRGSLGGCSVPASVLAEVGGHVLAVHGQADQQRLLRPAQQRAALDRFAGEPVLSVLQRYRACWAGWQDAKATLAELATAGADRDRELEELRALTAAVEAAEPAAGEDSELQVEILRLTHADDLRTAAARAQEALTGREASADAEIDALGLLTTARRALDAVATHDAGLGALAARLAEAGHQITDVAGELASYAASVEADPRRLEVAHERLAALTALCRRYGAADVAALIASATAANQRLLDLDSSDERMQALRAEVGQRAAELGELAAALSAARQAAAVRFGAEVTAELVVLAMPHAEVTARVSSTPSADGLLVGQERLSAGPEGVDDVELLLVPHPGAPARPLQKGASGGELSRVMLAVEVVFAGADPVPTMVFDEVDAGVGGRSAVEVGRRLARLARSHQVIVVTHLPQVAAFADRHLHVVKASDGTDAGSVTRSGVVELDDESRVIELSRMLAGIDTGLARGHAQELLAAAAADRS
ncbi:MAG TPA: DNA repair protein RecN [Mycobacteriales bacterium]|nr:DNA repair protein RecN [Mycobacteriales bacterium]